MFDKNSQSIVEKQFELEKNQNWRVGIVSKKDCYSILLEILKFLEISGYEWKLVSSSYKIKCRKKEEFNFKNTNKHCQTKVLNLLIQIFSVRK